MKKKKKEEEVLVVQLCLTLGDPIDCSPLGSSVQEERNVHGIFQARILEWVAISFSRGSSWPRDWSRIACIAGGFFTVWATRETPLKVHQELLSVCVCVCVCVCVSIRCIIYSIHPLNFKNWSNIYIAQNPLNCIIQSNSIYLKCCATISPNFKTFLIPNNPIII